MKSPRIAKAFLLFVLLLAAASLADATSDLSVKNGVWLLAQLKLVADGEQLMEPDKVSAALGLDLQGVEKEMARQPPDCSNPYSDRSVLVTNYQVKNSWYKPTADGVQHMKFPAAFINPAGQLGDPAVTYQITKTANCSGKFKLAQQVSADLTFSGLPGFACLSPDDLRKDLNARFQSATDGVAFFSYSAPPTDRFGTRVEFVFRMGAPCALDAHLTLDQMQGYRFQRATRAFDACKAKADHEYCATHPPFTWGEGDKQDDMAELAVKVCGGFDSYYTKEPETGEAPPAMPIAAQAFPKTPCDGK